jgi:hypothetical protein
LGVGLTTLPCKNENVEKPPEIRPDNGRRLWRRPRPKGCGAKRRRRRRRRFHGCYYQRLNTIWNFLLATE